MNSGKKKQLRKPKFKYIITPEVLEENSMNEFAIAQNYLWQIDEAVSLTNRVDIAGISFEYKASSCRGTDEKPVHACIRFKTYDTFKYVCDVYMVDCSSGSAFLGYDGNSVQVLYCPGEDDENNDKGGIDRQA